MATAEAPASASVPPPPVPEHLSSDESKADDVLAAVSDLSDEDQALAMELVGLGQAHLFRGWAAGVDTEERKEMLGALRGCGDAYPGGIAAYIRNARRFLGESASGLNPLDGYTPEVPAGVDLVTAKHGSEQVVALENAGLDVVKGMAPPVCKSGAALQAHPVAPRQTAPSCWLLAVWVSGLGTTASRWRCPPRLRPRFATCRCTLSKFWPSRRRPMLAPATAMRPTQRGASRWPS